MELAFASKELRSTCEKEFTARAKLGVNVAETLKRRLADIRAATSIADLVVGNPRILGSELNGCLVIGLSCDHQLILKANHPENPVTEKGKTDWTKVFRIKITFIGVANGE